MFKDKKDTFTAARQAGIFQDIAAAKGGHNAKEWNGRKAGEKRVKKAAYKWGTLVSNVLDSLNPVAVRGHKPSVAKQYQKADAYKQKLASRAWKAGRKLNVND